MNHGKEKLYRPARLIILILLSGYIGSGCARQQIVIPPAQPPAVIKKTGANSLLREAEEAMEAGEHLRADMLLERALRIDPRDAELWHIMAQNKLASNQPGQCVQFCLKSNSLAGDNRQLREKNMRLLEKARHSLIKNQE